MSALTFRRCGHGKPLDEPCGACDKMDAVYTRMQAKADAYDRLSQKCRALLEAMDYEDAASVRMFAALIRELVSEEEQC